MPLNNSQYDALMRTYNQKQMRNHQVVLRRQEELYRRIPQLEELDTSMRSCSLTCARQLLDGDASASDRLKQQLQQLKLRRIELLKESGFAPDYLEPPYDCKDCKDTGFIDGRRCHCFTQAAINLVYTQSNLADILGKRKFLQFFFFFLF